MAEFSLAKMLEEAAASSSSLDVVFSEEPVDLKTFINDKKYLGLTAFELSDPQTDLVRHIEQIYYPQTIDLLAENESEKEKLIVGPYVTTRYEPYWSTRYRMTNKITAMWGKGGGKDSTVRIGTLRVIYLLLCLKSPQNYYEMPDVDSIHTLNIASSAPQALRAFFDPIRRAVKTGWFADKCEPTKNQIEFDKNIIAISGHSQAESQEGLNLILGVADEIDAFASNKQPGSNNRSEQNTAEYILSMMDSSASCQPLHAKVLTPSGWKRMGDIQIGDVLCDPKGQYSEVLAIHPQPDERQVYRLNFSDGTWAEADGGHLWEVSRLEMPKTIAERKAGSSTRVYSTLTTDQLIKAMSVKSYKKQPFRLTETPGLETFDFEEGPLEIDPYLLGLLIGDGGLTHYTPMLTSADPELIEAAANALPSGMYVGDAGYRTGAQNIRFCYGKGRTNPLTESLKRLELWGKHSYDKFVPDVYKYASAKTRLAVLQGLMDTDGSFNRGEGVFTSTSRQLRDDVIWLARSLGLKAMEGVDAPASSRDFGRGLCETRQSYKARIQESEVVRIFRLARKLKPLPKRRSGRILVSIEPVRVEKVQCIEVSADSHLYITDNFVPTHNTRFPDIYKLVSISYPRYQGSPIMNVMKEAEDDFKAVGGQENSTYYISGPYATWEVNPRVTGKEKFKTQYRKDPIEAAAKYECKPSKSANPYFRNELALRACFFEDREEPIKVIYERVENTWVAHYEFAPDFKPVEGAIYAMHADLAVKGDRAGISMAHVKKWNEYETVVEQEDGFEVSAREMRPEVKVDFTFAYEADIKSEPPREIQVRWARQLCFELIKRGFPIRRFTYDQFQSVDSMQILQAHGIESERVSTDRTTEVWRNLRDVLHDGRLEATYNKLLIDELLGLTQLPNGKVDHPAGGSKDLADAFGGAVIGAVILGGEEAEGSPTRGFEPAEIETAPRDESPIGVHGGMPLGMSHELLGW